MTPLPAAFVLLVVLLLPGCGESVDDAAPEAKARSASGLDQIPDAGPCDSIVAGGGRVDVLVDATCTGCTVTDAANAADNDFTTAARMTFAPGTREGGMALRAVAPAGSAFPAGTRGGVLTSEPVLVAQFSALIRTSLAGVIQDTNGNAGIGRVFVPDTLNVGGVRIGGSRSLYGVASTHPFDAVEFTVSLAQTATETTYLVYEICNDLE